MAGSMYGVVYKIEWAAQHLQRLHAEIGRYLNGEQGITPLRNHQADGETILFEIPNLGTPPEALSLVVGDILHNLRSALDYLAWQLVLANGGTPNEHTQFPIHDSRLTSSGKSRAVQIAGGVGAAVIPLLEGLQPYLHAHSAKSHPLSILKRLSNIDKHRRLHVVRGATTPVQIVLKRKGLPSLTLPTVDLPRLTDSNTLIIGALRVPKGQVVDDDVEVDLSSSFYVALSHVEGINKPLPFDLLDILQFELEVVIPTFKPFLDT
jgi:hypothetical protein